MTPCAVHLGAKHIKQKYLPSVELHTSHLVIFSFNFVDTHGIATKSVLPVASETRPRTSSGSQVGCGNHGGPPRASLWGPQATPTPWNTPDAEHRLHFTCHLLSFAVTFQYCLSRSLIAETSSCPKCSVRRHAHRSQTTLKLSGQHASTVHGPEHTPVVLP